MIKMECRAVKYKEFDAQTDNWDNYMDRLQFCFEANGIVLDSLKRANFYTICGSQVFDTLLALITPKKSSEVTFSEIVTVLTKHYSPKPNEISMSYKFYKRDQKQGESAAEYIAQLRKISADCNFPDLERMLRDRLVCGLSDHKLQYDLLKKDNLTYDNVVQAMLSSESAGRDVRMIQNASPENVAHGTNITATTSTTTAEPEPMDINAVQSNSNSRLCYRCGDRHGGECRFTKATCRYCKKIGHIEKICIAKKKGSKRQVNYTHNDDLDIQMNGIYSVNSVGLRVPSYDVTVELDGMPVTMQVDSGAGVSLVNESTWKRLRLARSRDAATLHAVPANLHTWTATPISVLGQTTVQVTFRDIKCVLNVIVARGLGPNLIGRNWFSALNIEVCINAVLDFHMSISNEMLRKHNEVFKQGLGTYRGDPVTIHLKENATPRFLKARPVPFAIKDRVEKEIDRLVAERVLKPVSFSQWATPVVPIVKKSGDIRLCGDYRSTVNQATESDTYPMPTANEVFAIIAGGKYFTTLDLERAYTQVVVDENTAKLLTLNTCKGLYTVHRLAFGVKACPGIFQRLMTALLAGVPGVAVLIDDIIISGHTLPDMCRRLDIVLTRIQRAGLRLNASKCKFAKECVEFLGFVIDAAGIHPAPGKVESITKTPEPKNVQQLQAFLGLYNFYERFIPHKATILEPLHRLLDKSHKWQWTDLEQESFDKAKQLLSSDITLVHYDLNKPLVLTCDSSEYGAGAVLSHVMEDGQERPVAMSSRTLHSHERKYSQLDKEATAIMFGIQKFHNYLMGRSFTIVTDHKPLVSIFNPKKPIPNIISPRLTRISIVLTSHSYNIVYKPGQQIGNADGLSRWPQPVPEQPEEQLCDILLMAETPEDFPVDIQQIESLSKKDKILSRVIHHILCGWPPKVTEEELRIYWLHRSELSIHEGCILLGCRVVVPPSLRSEVLRTLHKSHSGIVQTKALARSYVWWPQLNEDIESMVSNCNKCLESRHMPPRTSYEWVVPTRPWSRINVDFAGPYQNKVFLIIVDAYSRWPEVFIVNNMTTETVIKHLRVIFATHGLCETLVSDNGTPFVSSEMKRFLDSNKIKHITTAPYHPATNGLAERMVQTVKDKLRKMDQLPWDIRMPNMLLGLRATPCAGTGKSPAELLMNRRLRTLLDTIQPYNKQHEQVEQQIVNNGLRKHRDTCVGQSVMYRNYGRGPRWLSGTVTSKDGPSSYKVTTEDGDVVNRHIDQILKKKTVNDVTEEKGRNTANGREDLKDSQEQEETGGIEDSQGSEQIIQIPSSEEWAEMLGIPSGAEASYAGGKLKHKLCSYPKSPYARPSDNNFIL